MRAKRQFDIELLQELKLFAHCKKKSKNPDHYCTQNELSKNLKMSLRDVSKTLSEMVQNGIIIHETYTNENHAKADKFYPARRFTDKEVMNPIQNALSNNLESLKNLASKMRENPAFEPRKMVNYVNPNTIGLMKSQDGIILTKSSTGKIRIEGYRYLEMFCNYAIETFSLVDSLSYAITEKTLEDNEDNTKIINELRIKTYFEIHDLIEYAIRPHNARLQHYIRSHIYMKVKQLFLINEMRKRTQIKT